MLLVHGPIATPIAAQDVEVVGACMHNSTLSSLFRTKVPQNKYAFTLCILRNSFGKCMHYIYMTVALQLKLHPKIYLIGNKLIASKSISDSFRIEFRKTPIKLFVILFLHDTYSPLPGHHQLRETAAKLLVPIWWDTCFMIHIYSLGSPSCGCTVILLPISPPNACSAFL